MTSFKVKVLSWIKQNRMILILFLCFLLMHGLLLSSIPRGICIDEAAAAYDGWCLENLGTDREGTPNPIYLRNFGGGQSVSYAFLLSLLFRITGVSLFSIRMPIFIAMIIFAIYGLKLVQLAAFDSRLPEYCFLAGISFMPVFVVMFRVGLDCNLMLAASTAFLYHLIKAITADKTIHYIFAGVWGGLTLYTYILSHLILPTFLLLTIIYLLVIRKFHFRKWICTAISLGILAAPLIGFHIINILEMPDTKFGPFTLTRLWCYNERANEMSLSFIISNLKYVLRDIFLFDQHRFNTVTHFFNLYLPTIIFFIIGLVLVAKRFASNIKLKEFSLSSIVLLWFIAEFILACITSDLCTYKVNAIFFAVLYIAIEGLYFIYLHKQRIIRYMLYLTALFYLVRSAQFTYYYFVDYPEDTWPIWLFEGELNEAAQYIDEIEYDENQDIYFSDLHKIRIYWAIATLQPQSEYKNQGADVGRLHYYLPDSIDADSIYVVVNRDEDYGPRLTQYGFQSKECGEYFVYNNPWRSYEPLNQPISYTVDHYDAQADENVIYISGWSSNSTGLPWDTILLEKEGQYYTAQKTERPDVASALGTSSDSYYGYSFVIPYLEHMSDATICFIDSDNQMIFKTSFTVPAQ